MDDPTLILAYLEGDLSPDERKAFENRLASDADLRTELEAFQQLYGDLDSLKTEDAARRDVRRALAALGQTTASSSNRPKRKTMWWAVAASLVLLCTLFIFLLPHRNPSYFQSQYPGLYDGPGAFKGPDSDASAKAYADGLAQYRSENYPAALELFAAVQPGHPDHGHAQIYRGSSLLLLQRPQEATELFTPMLSDPDFREYALWYLALAALHTGDLEAGRGYLEEMVAEPGDFNDDLAEEVLGKMEWGF